MSVGLLLVTHTGIGEAILHTAETIFGGPTRQASCLEIPFDADIEGLAARGQRRLDELDRGDGVLVLVDCPGATPANLAHILVAGRADTVVVTGLNLPMLLRLLNTPDCPIEVLCRRAIEGGREAIVAMAPDDA